MSTFLQLKARGDFHTYDSVTLCDGTDKLLSLKGSTYLDDAKTLTLGTEATFGTDSSGTGIRLSKSSLTIKDGTVDDNDNPALSISTSGIGKGELNAYRTARFHGTTDDLAFVTNYGIKVGSASLTQLLGSTDLKGATVTFKGGQLDQNQVMQDADQVVNFEGGGNVTFKKPILHQTVVGETTSTNFSVNSTGLEAGVDALFKKNVHIEGDLLVGGTTVTKNATELNVGDRHIYLNAANTDATTATNGGVVVNYKAHKAAASVTSISNEGVIQLSDVGGVNYVEEISDGAIVQISGAVANPSVNGLYKVGSYGNSQLTVAKATDGITAPFIKDGDKIPELASGHGETIQLAWVQLGHLQFDEHGVVEFASGRLDGDFDHSKYATFAGSVDKRSDLQVIDPDTGTQHLMKRVVVVKDKVVDGVTTSHSGQIFLAPNAYITGTSGDDTWVSSHRVYNDTASDLTIWARPAIAAPASTYSDPATPPASWNSSYYFDKAGTVEKMVVASGDSIQIQYVGSNRWITM
jgi:hypothetical protein